MENYKEIAKLLKESYEKDGQFFRVIVNMMNSIHEELGGVGLMNSNSERLVDIDLESVPFDDVFDIVPKDKMEFLEMVKVHIEMMMDWVEWGWVEWGKEEE